MAACAKCKTVNDESVETCAACGHELARVCISCASKNPAFARFCCGCGSRFESAALPSAAAWAPAELRQITIFFCDLVGSSELSTNLDPEDFHALLREFHGMCADTVHRHHGHVAQYLGDGLLAYFGYPVAMEDDARGAARAGLEIAQAAPHIGLEAARRKRLEIQVRVGIHTGRVVVGTVGNEGRHEALALGETPNIAARVQSLAEPSTVVVTDSTRQLLGEQFHCEEMGKRDLRGFRQQVRLHRVVSEAPSTGPTAIAAVHTSPMVGRERELEELRQSWQAVQLGASQLVCVLGEPGIGKSRLLREFSGALPPSVQILEGHCSAYHQHSAFYCIAQCLEADLGLPKDASPQEKLRALQGLNLGAGSQRLLRTRLLASVLHLPLPRDFPALELVQQQVRSATFEALIAWLTSRAAPTVMILEDLQWADPSTLQFLAQLDSGAHPGPVLALLTTRPELDLSSVELGKIRLIALQRLNSVDTEQVVRNLVGARQVPGSMLQRLVVKAEGNPLFVEEMTRALVDSDALADEEIGVSRPSESDQLIPTTLQNTLTARLDLLGRAKPTAQLAAVLGREFRREVLQEVWRSVFLLSDFELERDLRLLIQSNLLYARQEANGLVEYSFKHALVQDAAYQSLLRTRRREYHQRVADVLRTRFPDLVEPRPDLLAHHYSAAAKTALAVEYWEKAGHQALQVVAHLEAISHFRSALDQLASDTTLQRSGKEMDLLVALGVAYIQTKGFASPDVEQTYGRAVQLCDEAGETPLRVLYGLWAVNLVRSQYEPTSRLVRHFERMAHSEDGGVRLVCHACLGNWHFYRGNYRAAHGHLERAAALCDRATPRRQHDQLLRDHGFEGVLYGPLYLAWCLAIQGQPERAQEHWQGSIELAERIGDPYATAMAQAFGAVIFHTLGDVQRVRELADQVREVSSRKGFPFWLATASAASGWAMTMSGQADQGIPRIQEGLQLLRTIGAKMPYPYYLSYLVEAHLVVGQLDDAEAALEEAFQMSASNIDCNHEPELLRLKAIVATRRGDNEEALGLLRRACHLAAAQGADSSAWSAAEELAVLLLAMRQPEEAQRVRERIREDISNHAEIARLYQRRTALAAAAPHH